MTDSSLALLTRLGTQMDVPKVVERDPFAWVIRLLNAGKLQGGKAF